MVVVVVMDGGGGGARARDNLDDASPVLFWGGVVLRSGLAIQETREHKVRNGYWYRQMLGRVGESMGVKGVILWF